AEPPAPFEITTAPEKITSVGDCAEYPFFADDGSLVFAVKDGPRSRIMRMPRGTREVVPITGGDGGVGVSSPGRGGRGRFLYVGGRLLSDDAALLSVSLDGSEDRLEARGTHGWVAGDGLLYVRNDLRAIRRRIAASGVDETLFEAPSGK